MYARVAPIKNPYQPPECAGERPFDGRCVTVADVRLLKRSLVSFGLVGVLAPILIAFVTDSFSLDIIAVIIGIRGLSVTHASFTKFPWTALLSLLYPLIFVAACISEGTGDYRVWLVPTRHANPPLAFYLFLAIWGSANAYLVFRFYRIQTEFRRTTIHAR